MFFLTAQPDFSWDTVYSLHYLYHILEGAFHVLPQFFLVGVETHVLLLDSDVEQSCLSLLLHFLEEDVHGLMVDADQCLDHHIINQSDKVRQSLPIPIGNLQQVGLLFLLSSLEVHRLLLDLLSELHLILILHILQVALLVDLILHLAHHNCHLIGDDALIGNAGSFAGLILFVVEISLLPCLVI